MHFKYGDRLTICLYIKTGQKIKKNDYRKNYFNIVK
jgi:hypothetical protein